MTHWRAAAAKPCSPCLASTGKETRPDAIAIGGGSPLSETAYVRAHGHADDIEALAVIEFFDRQAMRLVAKLL